jgi:hypothetical protein
MHEQVRHAYLLMVEFNPVLQQNPSFYIQWDLGYTTNKWPKNTGFNTNGL